VTTPLQQPDEPAALVERDGPVCVVTLNRPAALNAVNSVLAATVGQALSDAADDPEISVVVLTGSGRAFCAGADLKEIAAGRSLDAPGHPEWGFAGVVQHWISKPVIAAVNGLAFGGGTEIVLACDLAVADPAAMFGLPEVTRGLVAAGGGVLRLHRQIPLKIALELALTGDPVTADSAARWGLVNHVADPGMALELSVHLARRIARNAPLAVQATKRLIHRAHPASDVWDPDLWSRNNAELSQLLPTEDAHEGARAFAERREPLWRAR
jgi:enoyl-CoA hydratase/carnithine racemase